MQHRHFNSSILRHNQPSQQTRFAHISAIPSHQLYRPTIGGVQSRQAKKPQHHIYRRGALIAYASPPTLQTIMPPWCYAVHVKLTSRFAFLVHSYGVIHSQMATHCRGPAFAVFFIFFETVNVV